MHAQTCTVFPLALAGGLHAGISGLADPLLKGTHLSAAMPPHHLQQIPDVSLLYVLIGAAPSLILTKKKQFKNKK